MTVNFDNILDAPVTEIERPKAKPVGTYMAAVQGLPVLRDLNLKDGTVAKVAGFKLKLVSAREDVDQEQLAEAGDVSSWPIQTHDFFYSTEQGAYAMRQFLEVTLGCEGATLKEMMGNSAGKMCLVTLTQEPYTDKNGEPQITNRIKGVAKL